VVHKKTNNGGNPLLDARPESYTQWEQSFQAHAGVSMLLASLEAGGVDTQRMRKLLYAAPMLGAINPRRDLDKMRKDLVATERHLEVAYDLLESVPFRKAQRTWILGMLLCVRGQVADYQRLLGSWRGALGSVQFTDLAIAIIALNLEKIGSRRINEDLATLMTAAAVPGGTRDEIINGWAWDAATIHKRRDRLKGKPFAAMGPYRHLLGGINVEKIAKKYPALFVGAEEDQNQEQDQKPARGTSVLKPRSGLSKHFLEGS
jgi:hypothetical protein